METYSTRAMTVNQADDFLDWFNKNIGTETEIDEDDDGASITCFELTSEEVVMCRGMENEIMGD
jgi:hypothetical protein